MRVISGVKKGTRLVPVKRTSIRPTTDRLKEVIFDVIGSAVKNAFVLDIFAGSGSLGIEALSRGAVKAIFIENDRYALSLLKQNLEKTGFFDHSVILDTSVRSALRAEAKKRSRFDFIFSDPPYGSPQSEETVALVEQYDLLFEGGSLIIEHSTRDDFVPSAGRLQLATRKNHGDSSLSFFKYGS